MLLYKDPALWINGKLIDALEMSVIVYGIHDSILYRKYLLKLRQNYQEMLLYEVR